MSRKMLDLSYKLWAIPPSNQWQSVPALEGVVRVLEETATTLLEENEVEKLAVAKLLKKEEAKVFGSEFDDAVEVLVIVVDEAVARLLEEAEVEALVKVLARLLEKAEVEALVKILGKVVAELLKEEEAEAFEVGAIEAEALEVEALV
ncbi:uncharacterized protein KY384_008959 [Bacidia gigantensis]|uniref:uncharacterized protein n=1 Tax=Bacidia gigantensis TaxID=2732470 RepID=UPI001D035E86|nr:uncharacterized protein KY384_008959 [Bacidia gigantensis]KAG8525315.1 hypothetical protein KY384_008959 [Bacidia gigantensis]